jgi:hypothetical protein
VPTVTYDGVENCPGFTGSLALSLQLKASHGGKYFRLNEIRFSGLTMAIGTADVVVCSKQTGDAISCTKNAKDPFIVQRDSVVRHFAAAEIDP